MYPQQQQGNDRPSMNDSFNMLTFLVSAHSLCFAVFLRKDFGKEGIGFYGLGAALMILVYGSLTNCYPMFVFFVAWILAVIAQRLIQFSNWRRGVILHSRYNGYPWLAWKLFPRIKSEGNAKAAEAFLCLAIGGLLTNVSPPLGVFVMSGFLSIMLCEGIKVEFTRKRLQAMRDAEIEQRNLAEQYKSGRF